MTRGYLKNNKKLPAPCIICGELVEIIPLGTRLVVCCEDHRKLWKDKKIKQQNANYKMKRKTNENIKNPGYMSRRLWEKRDCSSWDECLTRAALSNLPRVCDQVCGNYKRR